MVYCLPAAAVPAFVLADYLAEYTAYPNLAVTRITDEPWMEGDVVDAVGYSASRKITLHFSVVYLDVPWPSNIIQPAYATGTTLKLATHYAGQYLTIPPAGIKPAAGGPVPGPNTQATQYVCLNEYTIEWDRVTNLDDLDFDALIGCVNSEEFLGQPAGTLLCEGAPQTPSFVLNPVSPLAWKTVVTIKQRMIIVSDGDNAGTYGWNDWYNPKTQQWEALTLTNGQPPYDEADFSGMFS